MEIEPDTPQWRALREAVGFFNGTGLVIEGNEARVNGVWNHILSGSFPAPDFLICPELWIRPGTGGSRVDLVVIHKTQGFVLVFEGKASALNAKQYLDSKKLLKDIDKNREQVQRYLEVAHVHGKRGQPSFGILAQGPEYMFLRYDGNGKAGHHRMEDTTDVDEKWANFWNFKDDRNYIKTAALILADIAGRFNKSKPNL